MSVSLASRAVGPMRWPRVMAEALNRGWADRDSRVAMLLHAVLDNVAR